MGEEGSCDKLLYYLASGHGLCGQIIDRARLMQPTKEQNIKELS